MLPISKARIADDLSANGYSVQKGWFPPDLVGALLRDLEICQEKGRLKHAGIGRGPQNQTAIEIRNDETLWLDGQSDAQNEYLRLMDALRTDLNQNLFLGLFEFEAHYALYQPGGFYKKHVDALKGQRNRIVSTVTYLTPAWQDSDEGHLVLYDQNDNELTRILPEAGTLAVFMSENIPHEVLPPRRARSSIAGWYRCNPANPVL